MTATLAACSYYPEEGGRGATFPHDCSLVTDGAAAMVLTSTNDLAGIGHAVEHLPLSKRPSLHVLEAGKHPVAKAFEEAKVSTDDIDVVELHDCFTINQLPTEALGFSQDGKAGLDNGGKPPREQRAGDSTLIQ